MFYVFILYFYLVVVYLCCPVELFSCLLFVMSLTYYSVRHFWSMVVILKGLTNKVGFDWIGL
jgi:hypothetical protein